MTVMKSLYQSRSIQTIGLVITIAACLVLAFSLLLSREYAQEAMRDVEEITASKIANVYENTQSLLQHFRIYGMSIYQEHAISTWLLSRDNTPLHDYAAVQSISEAVQLQPFLSFAYLVNLGSGRVIDTRTGISSADNFADPAMLELLRNEPPSYMTFTRHHTGGQDYLALIIPGSPALATDQGFIIVLYDVKALEHQLLENPRSSGFRIHILDDRQRLVLGDEPFLPADSLATSLAPDVDQVTLTYEDQQWQVHGAALALPDWSMYFLLDRQEMTSNISAFQQRITSYGLVLIAALLIIIALGSLRTLKPFQKLAREIRSQVGPQVPNPGYDEADSLKSSFDFLLDSVNRMNLSLRQYKEIAKDEYLRQWLLQGAMPGAAKDLPELSHLAAMSSMRLTIIRIESYKSFTDKYNFSSRRLMKYGMGNIIEEIMAQHGWPCEVVDMGGDHLAVLLFQEQETADDQVLLRTLAHTQDMILNWLKCPVAVAISPELHIADNNLHTQYQSVYEWTMLKFLSGENNIYQQADYAAAFRDQLATIDDQMLHDLIIAVKQGNEQDVSTYLGELLQGVRNSSYEQSLFQLRMILYQLFKSFHKVSEWNKTIADDAFFDQFASLDDVRSWLRDELAGISAFYQSKVGHNRKEEIVGEIREYIMNHLHDPMLNLDLIAEHLGLSTSHIRHVFKEVTDMTLSDYILQQRIEQVQHRLGSTDRPVMDIAESLGFATKSHFYTVFKKMTGLTPSQYRASIREQNVL